MKTIYLKGIIGWDVFADDITKELDPNSREKIRIIVNSPGGDVSEGIEIFNIIKAYNGSVEIVIGAMAASAAAYIAMAVPIENRKAFPNSSFMIHEASIGVYGRSRDLKTYSERLDGINNILAESFSMGMNVEKSAAREMMSEDKYFTGWESLLENNIILDVVDYKDIQFPKTEEKESLEWSFFGMENKQYEETTAKALMYEAEDKLKKDFEKMNNSFHKAVAFLDSTNKISPVEIEPVEITISEGPMKLQDFLKSNPDAQAEYDTSLESARDQEREKVSKNAVEILTLESAQLSKSAVTALSKNLSPAEYAMEVVKAEKEKRDSAEKTNIFAKLEKPGQIPGEQAKDIKNEKTETRSEEDCKAFAKKFIGGRL